MMEIEYTATPTKTVDPWSLLPEELSQPSFFIYSPEQDPVIAAYVEYTDTNNHFQLDKLLNSKLLAKSKVILPSLLARIWTTPSYSVRARVSAIDNFTLKVISASTKFDYQAFIPLLIVALVDSSKDIRSTAAAAFGVFNNAYLAVSARPTVVGLTDLYHEDESTGKVMKWLSISEAKWLVQNVITPKLAECVLDGNYIVRLLGNVLNGASKKGKKEQYFPTSTFLT